MSRARWWLLLPLLAACGPQDVVVAFVPEGAGPPRGPPCNTTADCATLDPNAYCAKIDCLDPGGRCAPRPPSCPLIEAPVCGCDDGITYLNDCFRQAQGVTASTPGVCTAGATCNGATPCPSQTFCALRVAACMPPSSIGRCWWVPPACPGASRWSDCGSGTCEDLCTAVRSGLPHEQTSTCQ